MTPSALSHLSMLIRISAFFRELLEWQLHLDSLLPSTICFLIHRTRLLARDQMVTSLCTRRITCNAVTLQWWNKPHQQQMKERSKTTFEAMNDRNKYY
mmetsp:Transcript_15028/g.18037  ORF Transcript_15028/g.18037 Transcript_15028/m.18037 type:complete len:98 (+) Transcript_15028:206-499(+)